MSFLEFLSALFGWIYTLSWSLSFYSQPILNIRKKSTYGTTIDFPFINTLGFLTYFIYNIVLYSSPVIRYQYALRNHDHTPTVAVNDIVFAAHAFTISTILTSQYFLPSLWGFERAQTVRPSRPILGIMSGCIVAVAIIIFIVASVPPDADPKTSWASLDVIYALSYVKLLVTLVKYAPQLVYNFRQRSTKGWSIWQILFDFVGGILSIAQLVIDSYLQGDWSGITGNGVKFALGNVSMLYDLVFMTQHFVLYRDDHSAKDGERDSLLERGDDNRRLD
ncbi:PQ loop repeat-domain-containing protein [Annulohypoxylon moriforme]|nr:PQ loop repeat-domain-containing protein [Annulohypoxylon moriforme]